MLKNGISDFAFAFGEAAAEVARQKQLTGDMLNAATSGMAPMEFLNSHTAEVKALEQGNAESEARIKTLQSEISGMKPQQADTTRLDALGNAQVDLYSNAPRPPQQIQPSVTDAEKYALIAAILGGEPIAKVLGEFTRSKQQVVGFQNDQNQQVFNNELQVQRADGQALDSMVDNENRRVGIEQGSNDRNFNAGLDSLNQQIGNEQDGIRSNNQRITAENALAETKRKNLQGEFQKRVEAFIEQAENEGEVTDDEVKAYEALLASAGQSLDVTGLPKLKAGKTIKRQELDQRINNEAKKYNLDLKKFNQAVVQFEQEMKRKMTVLEMDQLYNDWKMDDGNRRTAISQQQADTSSQRAATAERNGQVYRNGDGTGMTKKQMQTAVDKLDVEIKGLRALQQQGDEDGKIESKIKQKAAERIAIQNKMNPLAIEPLDPLGVTGGIGELFNGGKLPATDPKFDKNPPKTKSVAKKPAPKSKGRFGTPK